MQGHFGRKILHSREIHKRLKGLSFLDSRMIHTLAASDFRLTYATMERLLSQAGSTTSVYAEILARTGDTSRQEKSSAFLGLQEDGTFTEVYSTGVQPHIDVQTRHISEFTLPLTQEMTKHLDDVDCFTLYSGHIESVSSETCGSLLRLLMTAIPADKRLIIRCHISHYGCALQALMRHCQHYRLQSARSQIYPNIEFHVDY